MANKLFTEFPPVSTEQWEAVINTDLKGADYEKKLVWKTHEGFNVRPYYRAENLEGLKDFSTGKKNNNWFINHSICVCKNNFAEANAEALDALNKGVESLGFFIDSTAVITIDNFATLLKDIDITIAPVAFRDCCVKKSYESFKNFLAYVDGLGVDKESVKASFDFNPLRLLNEKGAFKAEGFKALAQIVKDALPYKGIRVIEVDAEIFNNCGASAKEELGFALAQASEYLNHLTDEGVAAEDVARKIYFSFGVGSTYFMEIAKFRAARVLWANVVAAYGAECKCAKKMVIRATTSEWNQTVYDAYVNMLRGTSEAMSAAVAGVDFLEVLPFDFAFRTPNDFSKRIARNVQNILKQEAHFDKVVDPAEGSYYVENLTNSLAQAAWDLFKSVEDGGGYVAKFKEGAVQAAVKAVSDKKDKNITTRRETILGSNQYPNFLEKAEDFVTKEIVSRDIPTYNGIVLPDCGCTCEKVAEPLKPYRGAEAFEALRLATDRSGKEPKAFMLTFGNLAMCRARAQYSSNFFAVAGFRNIDNNRFESIEEGVKAAIASGAEIVVACSSDEEYAEAVPQIAELLGNKAILVVAGNPECRPALEEKGIKNFIHVRVDVLDTLKEYQKMLGIKEL